MIPGRRAILTVAVAVLVLTSAGIAIAGTNGQADSTPTENATNATAANATNATAANATSAEDSSWTTHRSDFGRTTSTSASGPEPYAKPGWDDEFRGETRGSPTVANGTAYLGVETHSDSYEKAGAVVAYNASTGDVEWSRPGLGMPQGSPTIVGNTVYTATEAHGGSERAENGAGGFYALDAETGETVWNRNSSITWLATPVHAGDRLYTIRQSEKETWENSSTTSLVALDPATGTTTWSVEADELLGSANGTLVAVHDGQLIAYDVASHDELWRVDRPADSAFGGAALANGALYGTTNPYSEGTEYAYSISLADGETNWHVSVMENEEAVWRGGSIDSDLTAPTVTNDAVYLDVGEIVRLDAATGETEWETETPGALTLGSPTVANGSVLVGASAFPETREPGEEVLYGNALYSFDARNGSQEWATMPDVDQFPRHSYANAPTVVGDTAYLTVDNSPSMAYPDYVETFLYTFEASETPPSPSNAPSDGYYENDTDPTVSIETAASNPDEEFGDEKTVTLNASASVGEGEIESYEWDVDDDGTFERNGTSIEVTLEKCELRTVTVRVTTSTGESTTESVVLQNEG